MDLLNLIFSQKYFVNNLEAFNLLRNEFTGVTINPSEILYFFYKIFFVIFIFFIFYYIGDYLRNFLKFKNKYYSPFVNVALGYIFIGLAIAFLGIFHLLYFSYLLFIISIAAIISIHSFYRLSHHTRIIKFLKNFKLSTDIYTWIVIIIVSLSFLKLLLPEIHEDGYHTDLAKLYLSSHTIMHPARDPLFVIPYAQLPEIIYILPIVFADRETARIFHFSFFFLSLLLLFRYSKEDKNARFAPLLFVTAPIVMRYSSSQYTDFFMVYCFLLSALLISLGKTKEKFLSGLLSGAVLSAKLWALIYLPIFTIFIFLKHRKSGRQKILEYIIVFIVGVFLISLFWQIRSFFLTGNPIFPFLSTTNYIGRETSEFAIKSGVPPIFSLNFFLLDNLKLLSPLFFIGILLSILRIRKIKTLLFQNRMFLLFVLMTILQFFLLNSYGRYLFAWFSLAVIFASYGIVATIKKFKLVKYLLLFLSFAFISYYFVNTILILPYGIGWADKGKYLSRSLIRDNASYYNFDRKFGKFINKNDLVATYEIYSFYYADFRHIDVNYIFDKNNLSFNLLKDYGVTLLLIKGGDIEWFCKKLKLTNCNKKSITFLSSFIDGNHKFFLYNLK